MKEAIITDTNGMMTDVTLVSDHVTGVFPLYRPVEVEYDENSELIDGEPERELIGYTIVFPVPDGLYRPRFDVAGYEGAIQEYETALETYREAMREYDPEIGEPEPQPPMPVDGSMYWGEGLTQEEIDELRNQPQPPSELDILGAQLVQRELETLELRQMNDVLGGQLVEKDLQILDLQLQMIEVELRLLQLEGVNTE